MGNTHLRNEPKNEYRDCVSGIFGSACEGYRKGESATGSGKKRDYMSSRKTERRVTTFYLEESARDKKQGWGGEGKKNVDLPSGQELTLSGGTQKESLRITLLKI